MLQVERKVSNLIKGQFLGFKGEKVIVVANGTANQYSIKEFERYFKFLNNEDADEFKKAKQEFEDGTDYLQIDEHQLEEMLVEAIQKNEKAVEEQRKLNEQEKQNKKEEKENKQKNREKKKALEKKEKQEPKALLLKNNYLQNVLVKQDFYEKLNSIVCKDGTKSYIYSGVTIFQTRGTRKVYCYFTGKMFDEEFIKKFSLTPEHYKATHNAYIVLDDESQYELINEAIKVSIEFLDNKNSQKQAKKNSKVVRNKEKEQKDNVHVEQQVQIVEQVEEQMSL